MKDEWIMNHDSWLSTGLTHNSWLTHYYLNTWLIVIHDRILLYMVQIVAYHLTMKIISSYRKVKDRMMIMIHKWMMIIIHGWMMIMIHEWIMILHNSCIILTLPMQGWMMIMIHEWIMIMIQEWVMIMIHEWMMIMILEWMMCESLSYYLWWTHN